ncbi:hypothetical protein QAD02_022861 [Eretmocerus hayati]|uniref:Uncharacterized protein n=1 Tax=Eretmocerus hayati TaxID=131215 RepID=A0ACC2PUF2_9HYME|nr:hypothetical protein QAD02_022861 [Eretmocerus hayati]
MAACTKVLSILSILTINSISHHTTSARTFSQCEAMKELKISPVVDNTFISSYLCIMKGESNFDTKKLVGPGHKSSYSHGIFQISSDKWCNRYRPGGICNKKCDDFLDDNIQDDIACAKIIVDKEGFKHWKSWESKCARGKNLPNLSSCSRIRRDLLEELESEGLMVYSDTNALPGDD